MLSGASLPWKWTSIPHKACSGLLFHLANLRAFMKPASCGTKTRPSRWCTSQPHSSTFGSNAPAYKHSKCILSASPFILPVTWYQAASQRVLLPTCIHVLCRYKGAGVLTVVKNVNEVIAPAVQVNAAAVCLNARRTNKLLVASCSVYIHIHIYTHAYV